MTNGAKPTTPNEGVVLGVDVGFSSTNRTTGFCTLKWDHTSVRLRFERTTKDSLKRKAAIESLVGNSPIQCVALDGPLASDLRLVKTYRAAEAILSCGVLQKRGKPGPTHSRTGQELHKHATMLAGLVAQLCDVSLASHPEPVCQQRIVEAFPSLYLAALTDEADIVPMGRKKTDAYWTILTCGSRNLVKHVERLLPGRQMEFDLSAITNHDDRASFVCALTALSVLASDFVAVGDAMDGDIMLPGKRHWGAGHSSASWMADVLDSNLKLVLRRGLHSTARIRPPYCPAT